MKIKFLIIIFMLISVPAWAEMGATAGVNFLRLGGGARPSGLGEAYTALANDSSALFYNPAGLARINFPEAMTMHNRWFSDTSQNLAVIAFPTQLGVFGIGYSFFTSGDIQGYGVSGETTSTFNTLSSNLALSFGRRINSALSWGVGIKYVLEKLENFSASSYALDLGLQYQVNSNFNLGASLLNYGSSLNFVSQNTPLPTSFRIGANFSTKVFEDDFALCTDFVFYPETTKVNVGVEYLINNLLALRLGNQGGSLRAGVGIQANLLALDYAYLGHQDLGGSHQISFSLLWGAPEKTKQIILETLALGKAYLENKKYAEAVLKFEKVLSLDSKNEEAQMLLKKAQIELEKEAFEKIFAEKTKEAKRSVSEIMASGKNLLSQGKYLEALAEFAKVLEIDPGNLEALQLQSEAQTKMERQLIERSREEARTYLGEALKLLTIKKYQEALEQVNRALKIDPKNKQAQELKKKLELILKIEAR